MGRKIAVVLLNLGGPDRPEAVRPFLKNLFSDPAIIRAPAPIRWFLARFISRTRAPEAKKNYAMMDAGGGSPLLPETEKQAAALETKLAAQHANDDVKCFIAMRYWHPFTGDVAKDVQAWGADEVILLPLYPQFSTTTTGSSITAWEKAYSGKTKTLCCYPYPDALIDAHVGLIMQAWRDAGMPETPAMLMSAHGLPKKIVDEGDPYQWQCEQMGARIAAKLPQDWEIIGCYQSRVGRLEWIGPSTEEEVEKAAKSGRNILISPIAFVSEHIETLVELGIEYREIAEKHGAASYTAIPALGTNAAFIDLLADMATETLASSTDLRSCEGHQICPRAWRDCPNHAETLEATA